ncbi:hypothetical protein MKW98_022362 [Papaver atlanticum]|uniref:Protein NRT1/ PTR FAMILY 5.2-like n=1 Tax=Papaver atlanticum TaxID=357466 RepID=A0AAD4SPQ1_9MAGN|nr:hypothetical protein MKW98_022362 [Papaver atlanticum]
MVVTNAAAVVDERGVQRKKEEEYTEDGTVDLKGRPVLRSKGGRWKACYFIVAYEAFERMSFYGISSNLILYLSRNLHQGTVSSSNNVTNWVATTWMTPIIGAFIADAYLGRYWTFLAASAIYLMGMILLTMSVSVPGLKPPTCGHGIAAKDCTLQASKFQVGIFYAALYIVAIGTGGTKPNISTMGADQFDDFEPKEKQQKLSFFNWWSFSIFFGTLAANTFLVYIQDNVGWGLGFGVPTVGIAVAIIVFLIGTPFYRHKPATGSPFAKMYKVMTAAFQKRKVPYPSDPKELYELSLDEYTKGKFRVGYTNSIRILDKAAIKTNNKAHKLCTVTQVEEIKQLMKMLPVLITTFIPSVMYAQINTLFVKQGTTLDRRMGPHFNLPPACMTAIVTIAMLISLVVYDRCIVPFIKRHTKNPRGLSLLQRMGTGYCFHVLVMSAAALSDRKRLSVAREHGVISKDETIPLTIFILVPQAVLMGIADALVLVSQLEFFYDQAPEGMKSLGSSYYSTSMGIGHFLSSFILSTMSQLTKKSENEGWIVNNLNVSRIDNYYWFLAGLNVLNLIAFLIVAKFYVYKADTMELKNNDMQQGLEMQEDATVLSVEK